MSRGRPSAFRPSVIVELLLALRRGNDLAAACRRADVSLSTVRKWIADGRSSGAPAELADFVACVDAAQGDRWFVGTSEKAKRRARALVEEILAEALAGMPADAAAVRNEVERVMRERGLDVIRWRRAR